MRPAAVGTVAASVGTTLVVETGDAVVVGRQVESFVGMTSEGSETSVGAVEKAGVKARSFSVERIGDRTFASGV